MKTTRTRLVSVALAASLFMAACGGGSSTGAGPAADAPQVTTGTVALLLTDKPTDDLAEINIELQEAILIGGEDVDGQQVLYSLAGNESAERFNLLDLRNFNKPIVLGDVDAGIYTKLRLVISWLELVDHEGERHYPALPANGKIDLLEPNGIEVLPGRTLVFEVDMEADKSFLAIGAGKSGNYRFRPVVKARFWDASQFAGDPDDGPKLARIAGTASNVDESGTFTVCSTASPDSCIDVTTAGGATILGPDGEVTPFSTLVDTNPVTVIGSYSFDEGILLNAVLVEIGGNAELVFGEVVSAPSGGQFLLLRDDASQLTVQLGDSTLYYDSAGTAGPEAVIVGAGVDVEGIVDTNQIKAALVFIAAPEGDQLSGTIALIPEGSVDTFDLTTDGGTVSVTLVEGAEILLVDAAASTVTPGDFSNLDAGQVVDLFGTDVSTGTESLFEADEVIVDLNASPSP